MTMGGLLPCQVEQGAPGGMVVTSRGSAKTRGDPITLSRSMNPELDRRRVSTVSPGVDGDLNRRTTTGDVERDSE